MVTDKTYYLLPPTLPRTSHYMITPQNRSYLSPGGPPMVRARLAPTDAQGTSATSRNVHGFHEDHHLPSEKKGCFDGKKFAGPTARNTCLVCSKLMPQNSMGLGKLGCKKLQDTPPRLSEPGSGRGEDKQRGGQAAQFRKPHSASSTSQAAKL